jgi:ATP-binding cassette, subfamily B, bacterial
MPPHTHVRRSLHALWRLRPYLRPHVGQVVAMFVIACLSVGASIVVPLVTKSVIDGPVRHHQPGRLLLLGLAALALGLGEAALIFARRLIQARSTLTMEKTLRDDVYAHLQRLPISFHDRWQTGQLLSRATSDLSAIRRFVAFGMIFFVVMIADFFVVVGLLIALYWPLGVLVGVTALPIALVSWRFERSYVEVSRRVQDQQGDLATYVEEAAVGIRVLKAFGRYRLAEERFDRHATAIAESSVRKAKLLAHFWALLEVIPGLSLGLIVLLGTYAVATGHLTVGGLVAFVSLMYLIAWPVEELGWILGMAQEAATAAERVLELLDAQPDVVDRPGARDAGPVRGRLRFEGVGFGYAEGQPPVLRRVDLSVEPGETVAVVGATGSGKTTLISLVPRLHDVTSGRVTLDGVDVRDLTLTSLRRAVGVAFEDPILFSASVRDNLTLGRPDATEAEIAEAVEVAQAGFVHELPWGLDTRVGEQGLTLSGGQRQRLALARAVLGRPAVLVLDDPLSALDVHTEALVEDALRRVLADTTALVVAHRPSTVLLADRVALLADGVLVAVGTHHELLETVPAYRAILSQESAADVPAGPPAEDTAEDVAANMPADMAADMEAAS